MIGMVVIVESSCIPGQLRARTPMGTRNASSRDTKLIPYPPNQCQQEVFTNLMCHPVDVIMVVLDVSDCRLKELEYSHNKPSYTARDRTRTEALLNSFCKDISHVQIFAASASASVVVVARTPISRPRTVNAWRMYKSSGVSPAPASIYLQSPPSPRIPWLG